jgi:hypothetical protein
MRLGRLFFSHPSALLSSHGIMLKWTVAAFAASVAELSFDDFKMHYPAEISTKQAATQAV